MTAAAKASLNAEKRTTTGKGAARTMRREGKVPAVIYGGKGEELNITLGERELTKEYSRGSFTSRLVDITVGKETIQVLPRDVQLHPVTDKVEHADFLRVTKDSKVTVWVKVKVVDKEKSPGLRRGGVLNVVRHNIEFLCTPESIPSEIQVSVGNLGIGQNIHINDIKLPEGVSPVIKRNFTVITVAGRMAELEELQAAPTADSVQVINEKKDVEGEAGAEGDKGAAKAAPKAADKKDAKK